MPRVVFYFQYKFHNSFLFYLMASAIGEIVPRHFEERFVLIPLKRGLKSNDYLCLLNRLGFPYPANFFRDCCYLLYDIGRETVPVTILNQFTKTKQV